MPDNKKRIGPLLPFLLWLLLMYLAMVSGARGEDRALLIGVGRYAHFEDKLNGVSQDIHMMTELAQLMGFKRRAIKVLAHESASSANVHDAVESWLIKGAGPEDRVLFYFSGHGSQVPDQNNDEKDHFDEVLLLYDVARKAQGRHQTLEGVLLDDDFNAMLARMQSRNIFIILDACHSGSATRGLRLDPRALAVDEYQVKYLAYSPHIAAAGGRGSFDVMEPGTAEDLSAHYVAITACRGDEKTVATARGSIFTLGLQQVLRSAAMAGTQITPAELQRQTTQFIRKQIQSDAIAFHPQIAGNQDLQKRPLKLVSLAQGSGDVHKKPGSLVYKSNQTVWLSLNKTCFEIGEALEISVWIPAAGHLNIISIDANNQATVLFPNKYHVGSAVKRGKLTIPAGQMDFELVADAATGPNQITAVLTKSPINTYQHGVKTAKEVLATLSPHSSRALVLRQRQGWLAAGSITADIRAKGQCR